MAVAARRCSCGDVVIRVRKPTGMAVTPPVEQQVHVVGHGSGYYYSLHEGALAWPVETFLCHNNGLLPIPSPWPIAHIPVHVGPQKAPQVKEALTTLIFNVSIQTVA